MKLSIGFPPFYIGRFTLRILKFMIYHHHNYKGTNQLQTNYPSDRVQPTSIKRSNNYLNNSLHCSKRPCKSQLKEIQLYSMMHYKNMIDSSTSTQMNSKKNSQQHNYRTMSSESLQTNKYHLPKTCLEP